MFNNLVILYLILSILSFILIIESISLVIVSIKAIAINKKFERLRYDFLKGETEKGGNNAEFKL